MKTIVDDLGFGKVFTHPFGVTMQHIHGDPLNTLAITAVSNQGLSELLDGVTAPAFGDIEQTVSLGIQDHRHVPAASSRTGLVNGQGGDFAPVGCRVASLTTRAIKRQSLV